MNENINPSQQAVPVPIRSYTKDYPSLIPLASNQAEEHNAEGIRGGEAILDEHLVAASEQHTMRKAYLKIHRATPEEIVAAKKRKTAILLESVGTVPVGNEWAENLTQVLNENHQAVLGRFAQIDGRFLEIDRRLAQIDRRFVEIDRRLAQIDGRFVEMDGRFVEMDGRFAQIDRRLEVIEDAVNVIRPSLTLLSIQSSRNTNRNLAANENIAPVPNNQGHFPQAGLLPRLQAGIVEMNEEETNALLLFYTIRPGRRANLNRKKTLLCSHLHLKFLEEFFTN